jgi:MFS family permease
MPQAINRNRLFLASCIALVVTSMTFAIRAKLELVFREGIGLSAEELGLAFGPAFYGFTLAMVIGGPLVDLLGMKRMLGLAFGMHALGITLTLFATDFWTLFLGTLGIGIGNGMVEAACNPLVATLYPQEKTKMLNRFHVWFPGGIVIGSLLAYGLMDIAGLSWQLLVGALYLPLAVYGVLFWQEDLPQTERVSMGISSQGMWKAVVTPLFLFMAFCMILTASTELGTTQRIDALLQQTGVSGILVLAFINGLMAIGRAFAGPVVHRLDTTGMLWFSAIFSALGLLWLSSASGYATFGAAAVFAIGVCYFWPTMLSFVSEKVPESGALGLAMMGGIGMFSVSIVLPIMGGYMDDGAGQSTLRMVAILPAILVVLFGGLFFYMRKRKAEPVLEHSEGR